jgi:hypothetical protein
VVKLVQNRRGARRLVLAWLFAFVAMQLGIGLALERPLAAVRDPDYTARAALLHDRIIESPGRPLILVLGTSRSLYGLRPESLEVGDRPGSQQPLVFNFSPHGYGPIHHCVVLERLLREGIRPSAIVLELAPYQLCLDTRINTLLLTRREMLKSLPFWDKPESTVREWTLAHAVPCFAYRFQFMLRLLPSWVPATANPFSWSDLSRFGWRPIPFGNAPTRSAAQIHAEFGCVLREYRVGAASELALNRLVETCRNEHIPLVVLFMPESPAFRACYSEQAERAIHDLRQRLENDSGMPTVDARDWLDSERFFADGHHLLPSGAEAFTRRFQSEVLPLFFTPKEIGKRSGEP